MKIAAAQIDIRWDAPQANTSRFLAIMATSAKQGADLVVFPECSLNGYCAESPEEARSLAVPAQNPWFDQLIAACREFGLHCLVGYLESDGDRVFNSLALLGPQGTAAGYRKTHLPFLGVDKFTTPGTCDLAPVEIGGVKLGLLICYDSTFPEATRCLALQGADLILLPTNWPAGAIRSAEILPPARALENHVYFAAINRIGWERGFKFVGMSRICHPDGTNLAFANHDQEEILIAEIDPHLARQKRRVRVPGKHEIDLFADRRPDLYGNLHHPKPTVADSTAE